MKFEFLNGKDGEQSSKRLFAFVFVICFVIELFANLFWHLELKSTIEENLFWLIIASTGFIASDNLKTLVGTRSVGSTTSKTEVAVKTTETT